MRLSTRAVLLFALLIALDVPSSAQLIGGNGPATEALRATMRADQTALADQLDELSSDNLRAIIEGVDPSRFALRASPSTSFEDSRIMIKAYARAALADRGRITGRWSDLLVGMAIGAVLVILGSVAESKVSGKAKRRKRQASNREQARSASPSPLPSALLRPRDPHKH
jgi:hypothetical protein